MHRNTLWNEHTKMQVKTDEYAVHVGFGFHVNCYHSYRGDTCDDKGFGSDIRLLHYEIDTLNRCNQQGIPVKGTWDFENAYTLEKILPEHAPDIIKNVRLRQEQYGDENILMGYNNGAMSAMTREEFLTSVQRAITNEKGSGLCDVFGACERIIRPQEVMFTPSQAALYKEAGIHTVCLYYSCVPFDAFRTIISPLTPEQAYNPLTYRYQKDEITILPMYSPADLWDAGGIRKLVTALHEKQVNGEIKRDVFLFINIDADSVLWGPFLLPKGIRRHIPGANGLEGMITDIADLDYVVFTTPGRYLRMHKPVAEISFGEDVADGNFSGYASWGEKPFNRLIWTRLERARMYARLYGTDSMSPSFEERIRLLSTTHFGLASPVLNVTRENVAQELSLVMIEKEEKALEEKWESKNHTFQKENEIWIKNSNASSLIGTQLLLQEGFCSRMQDLKVKGDGLVSFTAVATDYWEDGSVRGIYLLCRFETIKKKYRLSFKIKQSEKKANHHTSLILQDKYGTTLTVDTVTGFPVFCTREGEMLASWKSFLTYRGRQTSFAKPEITETAVAGNGQALTFRGEIHLPGEEKAGYYVFCFFVMEGENGIYLVSQIQYPYTREKDELHAIASKLERYSDLSWNEVVPMELTLSMKDCAFVEKRNFMDDISGYALSDFWNAYPENKNMDSFNHQLTGGVLTVGDGEKGIVLAHARQVLGSMAHCPMRLRTKEDCRQISLNPFGTYYGKQRHYPTNGTGNVMKLYQAFVPQAKSLAPSYNGAHECGIQRISDAHELKKHCDDIEAFSDGCVIYAATGAVRRYRYDNVKLQLARKKKIHL